MAEKRDRLPIEIPKVKQIRLALWGHVRNLTRSEMAERIILDRVSNPDNWDEVVRELKIEAAIARQPLSQYVASILRDDFKDLPVDEIDWSELLITSESSALRQIRDLLKSGDIEEAIRLLDNI